MTAPVIVDAGDSRGSLATLAAGLRVAPEFRAGLRTTLLLAVMESIRSPRTVRNSAAVLVTRHPRS